MAEAFCFLMLSEVESIFISTGSLVVFFSGQISAKRINKVFHYISGSVALYCNTGRGVVSFTFYVGKLMYSALWGSGEVFCGIFCLEENVLLRFLFKTPTFWRRMCYHNWNDNFDKGSSLNHVNFPSIWILIHSLIYTGRLITFN